MHFVAIYKCHRGGEWFRASLDGIASAVDGVVAVFGQPWISTDANENCSDALHGFANDNKSVRVVAVNSQSNMQDDQYADGMQAARIAFGEDAAAMIIDTDEIWTPEDANTLRQFVLSHRDASCFRAPMVTYIKSPLYEVVPIQAVGPVVAVNLFRPHDIGLRFTATARNVLSVPGVMFRHYSYVREHEADIRLKFYATESQEHVKSHHDWLDRVWPALPSGVNLHPAVGYERVWQKVRVISESEVPKVVSRIPFIASRLGERNA